MSVWSRFERRLEGLVIELVDHGDETSAGFIEHALRMEDDRVRVGRVRGVTADGAAQSPGRLAIACGVPTSRSS